MVGHWGTTPGLNFMYVQLNRVINRAMIVNMTTSSGRDTAAALVAHCVSRRNVQRVFPNIGQNEEGMKAALHAVQLPGRHSSHVAPETPGSIHEGGELAYALSHAFGAAVRQSRFDRACVVGDGVGRDRAARDRMAFQQVFESARDGAVLPILHLNGYKIANPCFLARIPKDELTKLFEGYGYKPYYVEGRDPEAMHSRWPPVLDEGHRRDQTNLGGGTRQKGISGASRVADDRAPQPKKVGPVRPRSTARRPRITGVRTKSQWETWTRRATSRFSKAG